MIFHGLGGNQEASLPRYRFARNRSDLPTGLWIPPGNLKFRIARPPTREANSLDKEQSNSLRDPRPRIELFSVVVDFMTQRKGTRKGFALTSPGPQVSCRPGRRGLLHASQVRGGYTGKSQRVGRREDYLLPSDLHRPFVALINHPLNRIRDRNIDGRNFFGLLSNGIH